MADNDAPARTRPSITIDTRGAWKELVGRDDVLVLAHGADDVLSGAVATMRGVYRVVVGDGAGREDWFLDDLAVPVDVVGKTPLLMRIGHRGTTVCPYGGSLDDGDAIDSWASTVL